jgi:hypothetical protein
MEKVYTAVMEARHMQQEGKAKKILKSMSMRDIKVSRLFFWN